VAVTSSREQHSAPSRPRWAWGTGGTQTGPAPATPAEVAPTPAAQPHDLELVGRAAGRPSWAWDAHPSGEPAAAPARPEAAAAHAETVPAAVEPEPASLAASAPGPSAPAPAAPLPRGRRAPAAAPPVPVFHSGRAPAPGRRVPVPAPPPVVDRGALRVQRVLVMGVLAIGWAISLSRPGAEVALPIVTLVLLAAALAPARSMTQAAGGRGPAPVSASGRSAASAESAAVRAGLLLDAALLVAASLCALAGAPVAAWTLGWAVVVLTLLEFTFEVSLGVVALGWLRGLGLVRG
jgi:hypothetical protein